MRLDEHDPELVGGRSLTPSRGIILVEGPSDRAAIEALAAKRDRDLPARLQRFAGVRSGRKIRYGRLLVEALRDEEVPAPLGRVLDAALSA